MEESREKGGCCGGLSVGCSFLVLLGMGIILWTTLVRDSQIEERADAVETAWLENRFADAVTLGEQILDPGFQKKEIHRAACEELDDRIDGYAIRSLGLARLLHFATEWFGLRDSARVHVDFHTRLMIPYFVLSAIKTGRVERAGEVFQWFLENPRFHNDAWKPMDDPLFEQVVRDFLEHPDSKNSLAKIDMLNIVMARRHGPSLEKYGPSPWGGTYTLVVDTDDPLIEPHEEDDPFFDDLGPYLNDLYVVTQRPDGSYLTLSTELGRFFSKPPEEIFDLRVRVSRYVSAMLLQTPGTVISAFLYFLAHPDVVETQPPLAPFFVNDQGEMSDLWPPFFEYLKKFKARHSDWIDRVQLSISKDEERIPIHQGHVTALLSFDESPGQIKSWVLPYVYGDVDMDGPNRDPKDYLAPPPPECNTPDIIQHVQDTAETPREVEVSLELSKRLMAVHQFTAPLQATPGWKKPIDESMVYYPRILDYPTFVLIQAMPERADFQPQDAQALVQMLKIPARRISGGPHRFVIRDGDGDVVLHLLQTPRSMMLYFTESTSEEPPPLAHALLEVLEHELEDTP